jgi:hypothetical protein
MFIGGKTKSIEVRLRASAVSDAAGVAPPDAEAAEPRFVAWSQAESGLGSATD